MSTDLRAAPTVGLASERAPVGPGGAAADVARTSDGGARLVAVVIALVWHVAVGLPAVLAARAELAVPEVVLGGWLLTAALGVAAGVRLLRRAPLPPVPLLALLVTVDVAVFATASDTLLFTAANWVWGTLGWFFVVALWQRPVHWLLVMLGAHSLIALAALVGYGATSAVDLARYAMYVYGTSSLPTAVFAGAAVIARLARARATASATANALTAEREAAEQGRRERRDRLALVGSAAGAVLAELADGRADPTDPQVQRRAVLAAARLRRLIAESDDVPDPLLHELRAAADLAERTGLPIDLVTIGTPPPLPVRVRRQLADPVVAALAGATGWARVTVVSGPDGVEVSLVTPDRAEPRSAGAASPADGGGQVEHHDERDGEIRWTQARWRR
ncbi:hypothetical protein GA0070616_1447 [Micromonospora nigra]|uniref:Uncharacterized protein n=1 Tax=Micromonospora nigra TaxID=145857 RepID=A0A1C6RM74_9ACTN|nr:hypothetical protein [Micromonospora nigra]SCL18164.1 hypothetical protein GA0070616_1447 [Micromonospora nigra]